MQHNYQHIYDKICSSRTIQDRLKDGTNADLCLASGGWLSKADKIGVTPQVEHEFQIYQRLESQGLMGDITPYCDFEVGCTGYPASITIRQIGDCVSLWEYASFHLSGEMSTDHWLEICEATGEIIAQFHHAGFVHVDLHAGNIVVELCQTEWRPYLIDFGLSAHDAIEYPFALLDYSALESDADLHKLIQSLDGMNTQNLESFETGLNLLKA